MPNFAPSDFVIETLAMWLFWSGGVWLALAAHRWRSGQRGAREIILMAAALAGWLGLIRLTTGMLGGRELIPLYPFRLVANGLPYYFVLAAITAAFILIRRVASGSKLTLALSLALMVVLPLVGLPLIVGDAREVNLFTDRAVPRSAALPPPTPITDPDHPGMVLVPEGPFVMGTLNPDQARLPSGSREGDEQPVRTVYLDAFYIDRLEVTNRDFAEFVDATGYTTDPERSGFGSVWRETWEHQPDANWRQPRGPGDSIEGLDDHPVVQVGWNDAAAYCSWVDKRLPSEAEWEKAARGVDGRDYPWGMVFDPTKLNFCDRDCEVAGVPHHPVSDGYSRTAPVGSFPEGMSPYGALDMIGNAWEWVADWYDPHYYLYGPNVNPRGPPQRRAYEASKIVRGGSFAAEPAYTRTTSRSFDPVPRGYFGVGFRCAADG